MLRSMRKNIKSLSVVLWLVILAFIATTFFVWGMGSSSGKGERPVIARVGGEEILLDEFQRAYNRVYQQQADLYRRILKDKFDEKMLENLRLRERTLENLITRRLLLQQARRLNLTVGAPELTAEIKSIPAFSDGGQFRKERYLQVLGANGLTPERFESELIEDLLARKVEGLITGSIQVTPQELREMYGRARGRVKVVYALFPDLTTAPAKADVFLRALGQGKPWAKAARDAGASSGETGFFSSREPPARIPDAASFVEDALSRTPGEVSPLLPGRDKAYILKVVERRDPDWSVFDKEREGFRQEALRIKREQVFSSWLRQLHNTMQVTVDTTRL